MRATCRMNQSVVRGLTPCLADPDYRVIREALAVLDRLCAP